MKDEKKNQSKKDIEMESNFVHSSVATKTEWIKKESVTEK